MCNFSAYMYIYIYIHAGRRKPPQPERQTDREIFEGMSLNDSWDDADLFSVFIYLWESKSTHVPTSWYDTMVRFEREFRDAVVGSADLVAEYNSATQAVGLNASLALWKLYSKLSELWKIFSETFIALKIVLWKFQSSENHSENFCILKIHDAKALKALKVFNFHS